MPLHGPPGNPHGRPGPPARQMPSVGRTAQASPQRQGPSKEKVRAMLERTIQQARKIAEQNGIDFDSLVSGGGESGPPAPPSPPAP